MNEFLVWALEVHELACRATMAWRRTYQALLVWLSGTDEAPDALAGELWPTHNLEDCIDWRCQWHTATERVMANWPKVIDETGLVVRVCEHNVSHPDYDSVFWMDISGPAREKGRWLGHMCCGCCKSPHARSYTGQHFPRALP